MAKDIAFSNTDFFGTGGKAEAKASLFERGLSWFAALRIARTDSEIERYINEHGGVLTDSLEREISQKFTYQSPGLY
jgi:hypothetical protein